MKFAVRPPVPPPRCRETNTHRATRSDRLLRGETGGGVDAVIEIVLTAIAFPGIKIFMKLLEGTDELYRKTDRGSLPNCPGDCDGNGLGTWNAGFD